MNLRKERRRRNPSFFFLFVYFLAIYKIKLLYISYILYIEKLKK